MGRASGGCAGHHFNPCSLLQSYVLVVTVAANQDKMNVFASDSSQQQVEVRVVQDEDRAGGTM